MTDYRSALRAKGVKPLTERDRKALRTLRRPGDVEIVSDRREAGGWRLHRHGCTLLDD